MIFFQVRELASKVMPIVLMGYATIAAFMTAREESAVSVIKIFMGKLDEIDLNNTTFRVRIITFSKEFYNENQRS